LLSKDLKFHSWFKHIAIWYYYVEKVDPIELTLVYTSIDSMGVDIFTKPLPHPKFEYCCHGLGLLPSILIEGGSLP
jgi:hypothetical protein